MPPSGFEDNRPRFKNPVTGRMVLHGSSTHLQLCRDMRDGKIPKKSIPPCPVLTTPGRKKGTKIKGGRSVAPPKTLKVKIKKTPKTLKVKIKKTPKTIPIKIKKTPKRMVNPMAQAAAFAGSQRKARAAINRMNKGRLGIELQKKKLKKSIPLIASADPHRPFIRSPNITPSVVSRKKIKNVKGRQRPITDRATEFLLQDLLEQRQLNRIVNF